MEVEVEIGRVRVYNRQRCGLFQVMVFWKIGELYICGHYVTRNGNGMNSEVSKLFQCFVRVLIEVVHKVV